MNNINVLIAEYLPVLILIIGVMAFLVSAVVQAIKNVGFLKRIPTDAVVIVLSIAFAVLALYAYAAIAVIVVPWYGVVGAIVLGFVVAFIAMFGWGKIRSLYLRFTDPEKWDDPDA